MAGKRLKRRTRGVVATATKTEMDQVIAGLNTRFGAETVVMSNGVVQPFRISSGIFIFDFATLGGIPSNRASMGIGNRHAGKSMQAALFAANAQRQFPGQKPVWIDVEGVFEPIWPEKLGVDIDNLVVVQPDTGEQAVDATTALITARETSLVIVDSIAALVPFAEVDSSAEDAHVGLHARLVGGMIRKAVSAMINERKRGHCVTLLFINQYRARIGGPPGFGEPRSVPGGKAAEYCTTLQWDVKNKEVKGTDSRGIDDILVNEHSFTISKNKLNRGPRSGEFRVCRVNDPDKNMHEGMIDDGITVVAYAKKFGIYTGRAGDFTLRFADYEVDADSAEQLVSWLYENREVYEHLKNYLIREQAASMGMPQQFLDRFDVGE